MAYQDLREYVERLKAKGKIKEITDQVDKDWEIAAICRVVFQDIPPKERPALFFKNVKNYSIPVIAGILGGSPEIYALALDTSLDKIQEKWMKALSEPKDTRVVSKGPCQENVIEGSQVNMFDFPVPVWTVGRDPAPYLTAPCVITRDRNTGIQNMGTYRLQLRKADQLGLWINPGMHGRRHIDLNNKAGEPTPLAIVLGPDPSVGLASVTRVPYGVDELSIAGGLRGKPVEVVQCLSHDLLVPAYSEIVIEGFVRPNFYEKEGPFGEYTGYMGPATDGFLVDITCITHRNNPVFHVFISQMPPSESSCIRGVGRENALYRHLVDCLKLPVKDVHVLESGASSAFLAISIDKQFEGQQMQAVWGAWSSDPFIGKITVIVDSDVDIRDPNIVNWAISTRVQPEKDVFTIPRVPAVRLDPSQAPEDVPQEDPRRQLSSKLLIDATMKFHYPPRAIPPDEHLELVKDKVRRYFQQSSQ